MKKPTYLSLHPMRPLHKPALRFTPADEYLRAAANRRRCQRIEWLVAIAIAAALFALAYVAAFLLTLNHH